GPPPFVSSQSHDGRFRGASTGGPLKWPAKRGVGGEAEGRASPLADDRTVTATQRGGARRLTVLPGMACAARPSAASSPASSPAIVSLGFYELRISRDPN